MLLSLHLPAGTPASEADPGVLGVLLEPKFTAPAISQPIPGAQETVLVPARQTPGGALILSSLDWTAAALDWPKVLAAAVDRATRLEQSMTIQWQRDSRKVYHYAVIESRDPFISSVIYSPGFAERFREFLGNEVLVVIPDRFSLFVFPRVGPALNECGPLIVRRYEEALFKVSLEVFLLSGSSSPKAIGKLGN